MRSFLRSSRTFVDTNVFLYTFDPGTPAKMARAKAVLTGLGDDVVISVQVANEFFAVATRKLGLNASDARRYVGALLKGQVVSVNASLTLAAMDLSISSQISIWDALLVQAAASAGCARMLSEDLNHGQVIAGVRTEDPFR